MPYTRFDYNSYFVLRIIESIASPDFIEPLKRELREGEPEAEAVYLLLSELHNHHDPLLDDIRKRQAKQKQNAKALSFPGALPHDTITLELECRKCQRSYHYEVKTVYLDRNDKHHIGDRIECKNCRAVNEYELTANARITLLAEMVGSMMAMQAEDKEYAGPLKPAEMRLADGTPASPMEGIEIYKKRIRENPQEPENYLRLGNLYSNMDQPDEAWSEYRKALAMDPRICEAYIGCMNILEERGEPSEADLMRQKILELVDSKQEIWYTNKKKELIRGIRETNFFQESYIEEKPEPVRSVKIGRNQPCTCGSGKKYKKCCGRK